jgi:catechol 2,3-dioxygenase-like lactoylglutathione lyase family enzyme
MLPPEPHARPPIVQQVTFLYTRDLAAAVHFYGEIVGLPLVLDQGSCRIYRVGRDAFVGLCTRADVVVRPSGVIFTLVTPDVDGWYAYLVGQGVAIEKPPTLNPAYNIYHLFVRDPDGYLVEIQTFLDPAWPQA